MVEIGNPIVMGEPLEAIERDGKRIDSDAEINTHLDSIFDTSESV